MKYNKEKFINYSNKIVTLLSDYLALNEHQKTPVVNYVSGDDLSKKIDLTLPLKETSDEKVLEEIKNYLEYSVRTTHPLFNNQLNGGFNLESFLAELIIHATNTSMATYEIAPYATLIEKALVKKLNSLFGFNGSEGIMVTGGSNANLHAIHCARNQKDANIKRDGMTNEKFVVYVSENAHYSFKKAMNLLGLGIDNIYPIKNDDNFKMSVESLKEAIKHTYELNKTPLMIASTAGTTVFGTFDPIDEINEVAKEYNLWHHVDAAWGGPVIFSEKYKDLLKGIEKADSITVDAHKLMGSGLITSFFLSRHEGVLKEANGGGGGSYLFHEYENADYDTGAESLQCGRRADALKLWLSWKRIGDEGFKKLVENQYELIKYAHEMVINHPRLELVSTPEYLNLCFKVKPLDSSVDINQYNYKLRFKLIKTGLAMVNFSELRSGDIFFRLVFANNQTEKEDIKKLFDLILDLAQ